jgi:hypothetical protein
MPQGARFSAVSAVLGCRTLTQRGPACAFWGGRVWEAARVSLCRCDSPPRYSITSSARAIMPALRTAWPICATYGLAKGSVSLANRRKLT